MCPWVGTDSTVSAIGRILKILREGRWRRRADIGTHYDKVGACGRLAKNNSATAPRLTAANIPKAIV